jgi:nucleotide-binding universal stress UspA family protein
VSLEVQPHLVGVLIALGVLASISATLYWMLHAPTTTAEKAARETQRDVADLFGSVIVVFSAEIHSEHMMALAVRLAQRERTELLAVYIIEVPLTLPPDAVMEKEHRHALDVLATAEAIARQKSVDIRTEIVNARQVSQGVLDVARQNDAHLLVLGAYHEGRYAGAPLGRAIETIAGNALCDVLIGIQGQHGKILTPPKVAPPKPEEQITY